MTPEVARPVARDISRVPYAEMGGFSKLFIDYTARASKIAGFFEHSFTLEGLLAAREQTLQAPHADRAALVEILAAQQPLWGEDSLADEHVLRLAEPDATVVVSGQQVGLFTGPTYTVLKAMTAVKLAKRLEAETGKPVVPVFWLGSEDHDFEEMSSTWLPRGAEPKQFHYPGSGAENTGPVGAITFDARIDELVAELEEALPPTEFRDQVVALAAKTYHEGATFRDAFARMLRALLPDSGLVIFAPDDAQAKRLALPLWEREVKDWAGADETLRASSERIDAAYHAQVHIRPTNLFLVHNGERLPIDAEGDRFILRGTDQSWSQDDLLALLRAETERFSPNVVTRPLTQDWLFPTVAYVGGPGETAYFGQYRGVYEWAGLSMPVVFPRVSVTFIEPGIRKNLDKVGEPVGSYLEDRDALFSRVARDRMEFDVEGRFAEASEAVDSVLAAMAGDVVAVDASLERTVEASRAALRKEVGRLGDRVLKADRRSRDQLRQRIGRIADALYPLGKPQERLISPLYFAAKYGPDFFVRLMDAVDTDTGEHFLIDL